MTFKDIFKQSFLSGYKAIMDTKTLLFGIGVACIFGIYIFLVYRLMTRKTFYSKSFNISLVAMSVTTAAIILTIQSNLVVSLGMVGALSIVRFRTAIKDPMDLVFLYWAISIGIICGAGLAIIGTILCLVMTAIIFFLVKYPDKKASMLLIVNSSRTDSDNEIVGKVKEFTKDFKVKSKNLTANSLDMIVEIRVKDEHNLAHEIMQIQGVTSASVLSHDGEITA